ncbi:MAG: trypsin-like peptidase domain-containing protein [Spirochaetaceae bacterium]|nr:trypsin-like peptidase domain-containing protein [Spirochaetaceae bacterium]
MYKNLGQKFIGACFILLRKRADSVVFLGTAFLVHDKGYLLTTSHIIGDDFENLMVARPHDPEDFSKLSLDEIAAVSVTVVQTDAYHNVALLELKKGFIIETPDYLIGQVDNLKLGTGLINIGFPYGHQDMHILAIRSSVLSSKVKLDNGTKLLLFDSMVHDGMTGGPLVSIEDERIVGIVVGRFSPLDDGGDFSRGQNYPLYDTSMSYAVSIEYGYNMLKDIGIEIN